MIKAIFALKENIENIWLGFDFATIFITYQFAEDSFSFAHIAASERAME